MFKQRLLTSLVLVPLVFLAIFCTNIWMLGSIVLLLVLVGTWEWAQLIPITRLVSKLLFILILVFLIVVNIYLFDVWLIAGLILWAGILAAVITFPVSQPFWGNRIVVAGFCLLLLPLFVTSCLAVYDHVQGKALIVYLLCLVWATDIGAYLAGKCWGRHKLIPRVSPGKTIEGAMGGLLLSMLIATIAGYYFKPAVITNWYALAIATTLMAMLGDLFISMLKRRSKLKDTGRIFPGHGGILDRLDSLIAATPLFYYGLTFWAVIS